jgi:serine acetyltransferase
MRLADIYWTIQRGLPLSSLFTCHLNPYVIPASTWIPHPYGITITDGVTFGECCIISPNVSVGVRDVRRNGMIWDNSHTPRSTKIGACVSLGVGCIIFSGVIIANDVKIGAGAIILKDVLTAGDTIVGVWK